jgi:hypothetical protein
MNSISLAANGYKLALFAFLVLLTANAGAKNKDCWADFFEHSQYTGKHFLIEGPAELKDLKSINGEDWDLRIDSLTVGPKAKVVVYENPNFKLTLTEMASYPDLMRSLGITEKDIKEDAELFFNANARIHDLSDFNFHAKIRSLKVECLK